MKPELIGYAKLRDIPVFVWTVDDMQVMRYMIKLGVYSITTNNVDLLRQEISNLKTRGGRKSEDVEGLWSKGQQWFDTRKINKACHPSVRCTNTL